MSRNERQPLLVKFREENEESDSSEWEELNNSFSFIHNLRGSWNKPHVRARVGPAAHLIRDAAMDIDAENPSEGAYDPYHPRHAHNTWLNVMSILCRRLCANQSLVTLFQLAAWTMLLLTFIEPPYWCLGNQENPERSCARLLTAKGIPAGGFDNEDEVEYYPNSHAMLLNEGQAHKIESICVCFVFIVLFLRIGRDGMSLTRYLRIGPAQWNRVMQLLALSFIASGLWKDHVSYRPYARLAIVMSLDNFGFQSELRDLVEVLPQVFQILALLSFLILFYGWFGTLLFPNTVEGKNSFSNLIESVWTLWMCVTTVNYPDVMMPAYNQNRWVALYFVSFMAIAFFFLMNLILAVIVNQYNEAATLRCKRRRQLSKDCLTKAYKLLDPREQGWIDRDTAMEVFCILSEDFPEFRHVSEEQGNILFGLLAQSHPSKISEKEFMELPNVLMLEFVRESDYSTWVEHCYPAFIRSTHYQSFCKLVKSDRFEYAVDFILLMNAIAAAIESYPELSGAAWDPAFIDGPVKTSEEAIGTLFAALYGLEIFIKITVHGWKSYIEDQRNLFDFTMTMLAFIRVALMYSPHSILFDIRLIRLIVMLRVLRIVRVLPGIKVFQLLFTKETKLLKYAASILLLLFFVFFLFSSYGVHQYGGLISRDPSNRLSTLLLDTKFSESDYWANNFNDMISSMNVLFNLLVTNNWDECELGFEAVTEGKWVRWFFLLFHLLGVVLVNNLVVAFVIEAFLEQLTLSKTQSNEDTLGDGKVIINGGHAVLNAATFKSKQDTAAENYRVRLRYAVSDITGSKQDQEDLERNLTKLLSQPASQIL